MNYSIRKADRIIGVLADEAGFEYVNMDDVLRGHEQCTEEEAMNGIKGVIWATDPGSYHPNRLGHELMADRIQGQIELDEPSTHIIGPNVTLTQKFTFSGRRVTVNVGWPGSDVVTTLISPSGVRYTRDDARDAAHTNGPTWETFTIEDPEPGEWTIEMFGADVDPEGEPVDLVVTDTPDWNAEPVADINVTRIDDDTYRFDATGSTDADGEITGYEWDFGDSVTMVPGAVVEHTFAPGDFKVALVVTDDDGGLDLTTTEGTITVAEPNRASDIVIRSGTQFTNQLQITGDTFIDGNLQCNSAATIDGRLTVAGTLHLTNDCAIEGDVIATGDVTLDSRSSITGDLTSAGSIQMQSSSTVTGTIAVTGALTIIDGVSVDALIASGHIGAVELQHPVLTVTGPVQEATEVATTTMWRHWLNTLARQSGAPPWSPGLSAPRRGGPARVRHRLVAHRPLRQLARGGEPVDQHPDVLVPRVRADAREKRLHGRLRTPQELHEPSAAVQQHPGDAVLVVARPTVPQQVLEVVRGERNRGRTRVDEGIQIVGVRIGAQRVDRAHARPSFPGPVIAESMCERPSRPSRAGWRR